MTLVGRGPSEGTEDDRMVGLLVGRVAKVPKSRMVALGVPRGAGVVPLDPGIGGLPPKPGKVESPTTPGKGMGKAVKSTPRTREMISQNGPEIWEKMAMGSNSLTSVPLSGKKPRPIEDGGCPETLLTLTLFPEPMRLSRVAGMSSGKVSPDLSRPSSSDP